MTEMARLKKELLEHYSYRDPFGFIQLDCFTNTPGDDVMTPDEDGDCLMSGATFDLMTGNTAVRVLIRPDVDKQTLARALSKMVTWVMRKDVDILYELNKYLAEKEIFYREQEQAQCPQLRDQIEYMMKAIYGPGANEVLAMRTQGEAHNYDEIPDQSLNKIHRILSKEYELLEPRLKFVKDEVCEAIDEITKQKEKMREELGGEPF